MTELVPAPFGYPIKLVRDNTPTTINSSGEPGDLFYGKMPSGESRSRWLRKKLVEEVGEYLIDGGITELRDVLAVVQALAIEHGSNLDGLVTMVEEDPRGSFSDAVMMYGRHPEFDR